MGYVTGEIRSPPADRSCRVSSGSAVDVDGDDPGPRVSHRMGDRFADPRAGAGDQRDPVV